MISLTSLDNSLSGGPLADITRRRMSAPGEIRLGKIELTLFENGRIYTSSDFNVVRGPR